MNEHFFGSPETRDAEPINPHPRDESNRPLHRKTRRNRAREDAECVDCEQKRSFRFLRKVGQRLLGLTTTGVGLELAAVAGPLTTPLYGPVLSHRRVVATLAWCFFVLGFLLCRARVSLSYSFMALGILALLLASMDHIFDVVGLLLDPTFSAANLPSWASAFAKKPQHHVFVLHAPTTFLASVLAGIVTGLSLPSYKRLSFGTMFVLAVGSAVVIQPKALKSYTIFNFILRFAQKMLATEGSLFRGTMSLSGLVTFAGLILKHFVKPGFKRTLGTGLIYAAGFVLGLSFFVSKRLNNEEVGPRMIGQNYTLVHRVLETSVFDDHVRKVRLLRNGHSLLGGVNHGTGTSVYGVFYMHEMLAYTAARKRVRANLRQRAATPGTAANLQAESYRGLMIGYGTGVAAAGLMAAGVHLDIFEIDAAVAKLASQHFDLLPTGREARARARMLIADAEPFVRSIAEPRSYDIILHDVFSGSGLPAQLFTFEFFAHMRRLLRTELIHEDGSLLRAHGIASINFVGSKNSSAFALLLRTLRAVFPYVRCYSESAQGDGITNFVFFASAGNIEFVKPRSKAQWSPSGDDDVRWMVLDSFDDHEVVLPHGFEPPAVVANFSWNSTGTKPSETYSVATGAEIPNTDDVIKSVRTQYLNESEPNSSNATRRDVTVDPDILTDNNCFLLEPMMVETSISHWLVMRELFPYSFWRVY